MLLFQARVALFWVCYFGTGLVDSRCVLLHWAHGNGSVRSLRECTMLCCRYFRCVIVYYLDGASTTGAADGHLNAGELTSLLRNRGSSNVTANTGRDVATGNNWSFWRFLDQSPVRRHALSCLMVLVTQPTSDRDCLSTIDGQSMLLCDIQISIIGRSHLGFNSVWEPVILRGPCDFNASINNRNEQWLSGSSLRSGV